MSIPPPRILFCSLSAKLSLYIEVLRNAQMFSKDAKVIGCDSNINCDAAKKIEHFIHLPNLDSLTDTQLMEILSDHKITHILPTRDGELSFWAKKKDWLSQHNITTWVSEACFVDCCNNKLLFSNQWADSPITPIRTLSDTSDRSIARWAVKEKAGSGSTNIALNIGAEEASKLASESFNQPIFQPFIRGKEFTAEAWISKISECYGPLLRWRNKVINGESHQTTQFNNSEWEGLVSEVFLHTPGAYGHCLAQVIVDDQMKLHLIEINPRLGGASPLALRAGLSSVYWHLMEEAGEINAIPRKPVFSSGLKLTKKNGVAEFSF